MPTSEGWKWVTPEMWKFRWSVADKETVDDFGFYPDKEMGYFRDKGWYIDATKALIQTEIWEKNPNIHPSDLAVQFLERYLDTQQITIRPYEMILGHHASDVHGLPYCPISLPWPLLVEAYNKTGRVYVWEDDKKVLVDEEKLKRLEKYAMSYNPALKLKEKWSETEWLMYFYPQYPARYFEPAGGAGMRANPDHYWYLRIGLRGLIDLKRQSMERFEGELASGEQAEKLKNKIHNCKNSIRATEAVIRWIKRHAAEARKMLPEMPDAKAREILEQVAKNCEWVAENAPRTFWEAVQLYWFCLTLTYGQIETGGSGGITFRPDQTFWEWYERDVIKEKNLSRQRAAEIVACHASKMAEQGGLLGARFAIGKSVLGIRDASVWTLGGQDGNGKDVVNDLTMLILDVHDGYRFNYPDIKFRWCTKTTKESFRGLVEVMRTGLGLPSIRNDEVIIPSMLDMYKELTLEEARSWAIVGCNTPGPTINSKGTCRREAWVINYSKAIETALFNGRDPEAGFEWYKSIETGDPTRFKDFEEFYHAWLKQWEWVAQTEARLRNDVFAKWREACRRLFLSMLYKGCMDAGDDITQYDAPRFSFQTFAGWVDTIDSLATVRYWIYDKKKYTMAQLLEALKTDWEGYGEMRQDFKNAPKFGNDDDYVDQIMVRATNDVYNISWRVKDDRGQPIFVNALPLTLIYHHAPCISALPNGRKRGEALCDGGNNPHAEFDKSGPWGRLRSALKVDQEKFKAWIYNMKIDYPSVEGEAGLQKLMDYLHAGLMGGQSQMQINFLSRGIYEDAQKHPEKYPYLAVRVSGYTAYFTDLPKFVQDAVIARVDHTL